MIIDEKNEVIYKKEIEEMMRRMKRMREEGIKIILIQKKMKEVREMEERVKVMREGEVDGKEKIEDVKEDEIMKMVMGNEVDIKKREKKRGKGRKVIEMKDVKKEEKENEERIRSVRIKIGEGEIIGVEGVEGRGKRGIV